MRVSHSGREGAHLLASAAEVSHLLRVAIIALKEGGVAPLVLRICLSPANPRLRSVCVIAPIVSFL